MSVRIVVVVLFCAVALACGSSSSSSNGPSFGATATTSSDDGGTPDGSPTQLPDGPPGSPDPTFGDHGIARLAVPGVRPERLVLGADGSIVVAGELYSDVAGTQLARDVAVVKVTRNGTLDSTFGSGGTISAHVQQLGDGAGQRGAIRSLFVDDAGNVIVAFAVVAPYGIGLVRFTRDGQLDATFAGGRFATFEGNELLAAGPGPGGKTLMATKANSDGAAVVMCIDAAGNLDAAFGSGGSLKLAGVAVSGIAVDNGVVSLNVAGDWLQLTHADAAGTITNTKTAILGGGTYSNISLQSHTKGRFLTDAYDPSSEHVVIAIGDDGTLNPAFSPIALPPYGDMPGDVEGPVALAAGANGKVYAASGVVSSTYRPVPVIRRYDASGGIDATFGNAGTLTPAFRTQHANIGDARVASDGRLVFAGFELRNDQTTDVNAADTFIVARYLP
jgi:uncharacterized delta-60 repeat protein